MILSDSDCAALDEITALMRKTWRTCDSPLLAEYLGVFDRALRKDYAPCRPARGPRRTNAVSPATCRLRVGETPDERAGRIVNAYEGMDPAEAARWEGCAPRTIRIARRRHGREAVFGQCP